MNPLPVLNVIYGGSNLEDKERSGGRISSGIWLDACQEWGLDSSFFMLEHKSINFAASSNGVPNTLGRLFHNVLDGRETLLEDSVPGLTTGTDNVSVPSRFWGVEANIRKRTASCYADRLMLFAGFRYLELDEGLIVNQSSTFLPTIPLIGGDSFVANDTFGVHNRFYGGQIGGEAEFHMCNWTIDVIAKIALGGVEEIANVHGTTVITTGGVPMTFPAGLLALTTNSGRYSRHDFAAVPEVTANLGYDLTSNIRVFVGYNFIYISEVARPGDLVDRNVNTNFVPVLSNGNLTGPLRPTFSFHSSEYWAQGLNVGVQFHF
jgi:hypothetical protein